MVTFTCNNCGDSVKKNKVEKHFSFECKRKSGGPNVCCIDCLKDFRENYEAHTSCFTEDERYSAKGTFVAKDPKNKQARKQMTWSEIIQSVYDNNKNLDRTSFRIIGLIKDVDNVPRKEAKFKNFCKNNGHLRQFKEIEISKVFSLLQEESKKAQDAPAAVEEEKINSAKEETVENKENNEKNKKKRAHEEEDQKKNKKLKAGDEEVITNGHSDKKKKSKKRKAEESVIEGPVQPSEDLTNGVSKKKKKKKNKQSVDEQVKGEKQLNGEEKEEKQLNGEVKEKKKKKKDKAIENNEADLKQSKRQAASEEEAEDESKTLNASVGGSIIKSPHRSKKDEPDRHKFRDTVLKLLKPGEEIKLKSLKKMIFATYKSNEEEVPKEVRENFLKKISKIPNVTLNEKMVKLGA